MPREGVMESYDAIYQAVRSRISNGDIGGAVAEAIRDINIAHYFEQASQEWVIAASEQQRPSVLFKPKVYIDGDQWCALYSENLIDGVCGFGDSPAKALYEFDIAFNASNLKKEGE